MLGRSTVTAINMDAVIALLWTGRLIALAVLLQTAELFFVREWPWPIVASEFPRPLRPFVRAYRFWLLLRLLTSIYFLFIPSAWPFAVLIFSSWMIALRWRGTFNGGSDGMTMVVLCACLLAQARPDLAHVGLWYIAIQIALSYAVAGVAKLRHGQWRDGQALAFFLERRSRAYDRPAAWAVLVFECLWPLALISPQAALVFLTAGAAFHLANAYLFGLNRFFFAWLAGYPAVYWASQHLPPG